MNRAHLQAIGPGILFAGAAIGVSHLVQSTRAGAGYGFDLLWAVLLVLLMVGAADGAHITDKLVVDTSKTALERLIHAPVAPLFLLRLDKREAEQVAGHSISGLRDAADFAGQLISKGVARNISIGGAAAGAAAEVRS